MAAALQSSIDGDLQAPADARISVLDDGLLRGDGAFEAIKLYGAHPFRLDAHLARLLESAAAIELEIDRAALAVEIEALLELAPGDRETMLRIVVTRGGRRILLIEEIPEWPQSARVALVELSPNEILAGVKSISYAANMQASRIARRAGADEAVYVDRDGIVLEAPTSSVFWVSASGEVRTPALEAGILDSITRRVILDSIDCAEGLYPAEDLRSAGAAFLASTTREVQPIAFIDGSVLASADGGEAAREAAAVLADAVRAERAAAGLAG